MPPRTHPALLALAALFLSAGVIAAAPAEAQQQPARPPGDTGQNPAAGSQLPPNVPGAAAGPGPDAARQAAPGAQRDARPPALTQQTPEARTAPPPGHQTGPALPPRPTTEPRQQNDFTPPPSPIEERPGERNRQPSSATAR